MINEDFRKMALSQYGCDGGNLASKIWTCGLEWGGGYDDNQIKSSDMKELALGAWDLDGESVIDSLAAQYNQKLAWFFSYLFKWDVSKYTDEAVKYGLFCHNGIGYKMNAFPLSYKNRNSVSWEQKTKDLIGLHSFEIYKEWCIQERGKYFQKLASTHSPKLILCTGITSTMEFIRFFGCDLESYREIKGINLAKTNKGNTLVMVVPFFGGANGINSYEKMEALVNVVNSECSEYFNSSNWMGKIQ
ncbi:MAG: hypothetical protein ISR69_15585 [Gammaproteobacteria bacterium]|nr:hypothetical protein [Gammaproteobacteria bacterium]